jgi:hypothetical protein
MAEPINPRPSSATMTDEQTEMLVLKDATESYFLLSLESLEQGRGPEDR